MSDTNSTFLTGWANPSLRFEAFQRFYTFHLTYRTHPGCVYFWLPAIAEAYDLDTAGRDWLTWLNGNTQNPVTSLLLLDAAPTPDRWADAVALWNDHFRELEWDTDRRHQKGRFGEATERWYDSWSEGDWQAAGILGWDATWRHAKAQPYMGRLSAWSMTEYARILHGDDVPDADTFLMGDLKGSLSHRNGALVVFGRDAVHWRAEDYADRDRIGEADAVAEGLLSVAQHRNPSHPDVTRLTLESALCTYKGWYKQNRRYPNVYADMAYYRLKKAESRWGDRFQLLWDARADVLPAELRLEDSPYDPGLVPDKQNHYLRTGEVPMLGHMFPDMWSSFDDAVATGAYGLRKDLR